jgi:hypothetical protein
LDLQRLDIDHTAAIQEVTVDEHEDPVTGEIFRRTKVKLWDKLAALRDLARCVGLMREEHVLTIEHRIKQMSPQERVQLAEELLERGLRYLPAYEAAVARGEISEPDGEGGVGEAAAPPDPE